MRYRSLGRSGMEVSEIGFGTWGLGGVRGGAVAYGPTDDAESLAALRQAFDRGVTFYDTADFYGFGHSEMLLGEALHAVRDQVVLTTKAGFCDIDEMQDFSPKHLRSALDHSLERLRTTYVDLFLLHSPPRALLEMDSDIWATAVELKRTGKARAIGVSVRSPEDGLAVVKSFAPDAVEVNYNLTDQRAAQLGLLDLCREQGVGTIIRTPLCFGFLTGAFASQESFDTGDHRSRWSPEQRRRWNEAPREFADCVTLENEQTAAQFALRFCLSHPAVSTTIPGMLTVEHVEENVRASDLGPLAADELYRIARHYRDQTFFLGRESALKECTK